MILALAFLFALPAYSPVVEAKDPTEDLVLSAYRVDMDEHGGAFALRLESGKAFLAEYRRPTGRTLLVIEQVPYLLGGNVADVLENNAAVEGGFRTVCRVANLAVVTQFLLFRPHPYDDRHPCLQITYLVHNVSARPLHAELSVLLDTGLEDDGNPFRFPGDSGPNEKEAKREAVPDFWYTGELSGGAVLQGVMRHRGWEPPTRIVVGSWKGLFRDPMGYKADPQFPLRGMDTAILTEWGPKKLGVSETWRIDTALGRYRPPPEPGQLLVRVSHPPFHGETNFPLFADVENTGDLPLENMTARIELPASLQLLDAGPEKRTNLLGRRSMRQFSWRMRPRPEALGKTLRYRVVVTATRAGDPVEGRAETQLVLPAVFAKAARRAETRGARKPPPSWSVEPGGSTRPDFGDMNRLLDELFRKVDQFVGRADKVKKGLDSGSPLNEKALSNIEADNRKTSREVEDLAAKPVGVGETPE